MKLAISSDWHGDKSTLGVPRFEDVRDAVKHSVRVAIAERVDGYVFPGDLCDPDAGSVVMRVVELAMATALELAMEGIPSLWVAGNHCVIEDGSGDTSLSPLRALAHVYPVTVAEVPTVLHHWGEATILALPYTASSHPYDVREVLDRHLPADGSRVVVVGHLAVPGIQPGEETTEMARGREVVLPLDWLHALPRKRRPALIVNGHYHRQQEHRWPPGDPDPVVVHVPGAMARLTAGEREHQPGFLLAEVG